MMILPYSLFQRQKPALQQWLLPLGFMGMALLSGCQTPQEQKIAEAKALAQQQSEKQQSERQQKIVSKSTATNITTFDPRSDASPVSGTPTQQAPKTAGAPKIAMSLPIYPGAVLHGPNG